MNLAQKYNVSMTEISIAWLLTKVDAPICDATKLHHVDALVAAVDLKLSDADLLYLEEAYVPHPLSGVMAQNTPDARTQKHVWIKNGGNVSECSWQEQYEIDPQPFWNALFLQFKR